MPKLLIRRLATLVTSLAAAVFACALKVGAENIQWHPSSPIHLGSTFDPNFPTDAKIPCLNTNDSNTEFLDGGAPKTEFNSKIIKEKKELYSLFSVSASLSASYGTAGGNASMSSLNELSSDSETVTWALSAKSDFGRVGLKNVELKPQYKDLPASSLNATCGSQVIVMERREGVVSAIFTFRSSSKRTRDKLSVALGGNWDGGSFSANLGKELRNALATTEVTFTFFAKGGDGLSATAGFVTSFDDIDKIRERVAEYIRTMTREKAPAAEYFPAALPNADGNIFAALDKRERVLTQLWYAFLDADSTIRQAKDKISNLDKYWFVDHDVLSGYLVEVMDKSNAIIDSIQHEIEICFTDKEKCKYSPVKNDTIQWPIIEVVVNGAGYGCENAECHGIANFLLILSGPGGVKNILYNKVSVILPGAAWGYNCGEKKITDVGLQVNCITSFNSGERGDAVRVEIIDTTTHHVAYVAKLLDLDPEFALPGK